MWLLLTSVQITKVDSDNFVKDVYRVDHTISKIFLLLLHWAGGKFVYFIMLYTHPEPPCILYFYPLNFQPKIKVNYLLRIQSINIYELMISRELTS